MRIAIHRTIPDDSNLRRQWNALVEGVESPQVFYTHEWALAVERAYHGTLIPWLLLQYEGEDLKGVAALATDPAQKQASWLAGTTADYCDFVSASPDRVALVESTFAELRKLGIDEISVANLPADSPTVPAIRTLGGRHGYHAFLRTAYHCAQAELGSKEDRQQLKSKLNGRKIFRRGMNFLGRQGAVSLLHRTSWDTIAPVLSEFSRAHVARFLATGRLSNHISAQRRVFLEELAKLLSASGWLALSQLNAGEQTVAWSYGFRFHGTWFWYQPTFDSQFEQVSPGYCLLSKIIIEACADEEMKTVDMGLGAEGYKERFANSVRKTLHATISSSHLRTSKAMMRYGAARAVTVSPGLERQVRAGLRHWTEAREHFRQAGSGANWMPQRIRRWVSSREEVVFYSWTAVSHEAQSAATLSLVPLTLELLAEAAMRFEGERETQTYLLRAASRWKSSDVSGHVLLQEDGAPVHFGWTSAFEGFWIAELKTKLSAPTPDAALIFDCWTPLSARGRGYYGIAVSRVAEQLSREERSSWIFSAASNHASIRGLAKTAFEPRFSLVRRSTLMFRRITKAIPRTHPSLEVPVGP